MFGASRKICACEIQAKHTVTEVCQFHFDSAYKSCSFSDNDFFGHLCFLQVSRLIRAAALKKRSLLVFCLRVFCQPDSLI